MVLVEVTFIAQSLRVALPIGHTCVEVNFVLACVRTGTILSPKHSVLFIYYLLLSLKVRLWSVPCFTIIYHHCHHVVQVSALSGPSSGIKWVQDMYKMYMLLLGNAALPHRKHSVLFTVITIYILAWDDGQSL